MCARFIGLIPAAPLFGSLIDKSCQLWHVNQCDADLTSDCLEYDNKKFKSVIPSIYNLNFFLNKMMMIFYILFCFS